MCRAPGTCVNYFTQESVESGLMQQYNQCQNEMDAIKILNN